MKSKTRDTGRQKHVGDESLSLRFLNWTLKARG